MKRIGLFFSIFIVVLTAFYLEPVLFPPKKEVPVETTQTPSGSSHTALNYEELAAAGFSLYINKSVAELEKELGTPTAIEETGYDYELRIYENEENQYIEVNVTNDTVYSIKTLGNNDEQLAPFTYGMNMSDLSSLTTIYPNFSFSFQDELIEIELMEEDMNYRPLIAFDNESFAILFFNQVTGNLFAVDYMNKETLLTLMPYQINTGMPLLANKAAIVSSQQAINLQKENRSFYVINHLRSMDNLVGYTSNLNEQQVTSELLAGLLSDGQRSYLSTERNQLLTSTLETGQKQRNFVMTNTELTDFLAANDVERDSGIFDTPVTDPTFSILFWYSDPYLHARFMHEHEEVLGIAFSEGNVLVLMEEQIENQSKESESR